MPFLETVDQGDRIALATLHQMQSSDPEGVASLIALPELAEGIRDQQALDIPIVYLGFRMPLAAAAIKELPWYKEYIDAFSIDDVNRGPEGVFKLLTLAAESPDVFWAVLDMPWIQGTQEGLDRDTVQILDFLGQIAIVDSDSTLLIVAGPLSESVETEDGLTLDILNQLIRDNPEAARALLSDPAVTEGMKTNPTGIVALLYLKTQAPEVSAQLAALPWIQEGIEPSRVSNVSLVIQERGSDGYTGLTRIMHYIGSVFKMCRNPYKYLCGGTHSIDGRVRLLA